MTLFPTLCSEETQPYTSKSLKPSTATSQVLKREIEGMNLVIEMDHPKP